MKRFLFLLFYCAMGGLVQAQSYRIEVPQKEVPLNQPFYINIVAENATIRRIAGLPKVQGMQQGTRSSSTMMNIVNGKRSSRHEVKQSYMPQKQGTITILPFTLDVDGNKVKFEGARVKVTAPVKRQASRDPFDSFFRRNNKPRETAQPEYFEVADDAFFAITSDKDEVYQGEGFTITVAFYFKENNRVVKYSDDLGEQVGDIIQKIKPENCWEETIDLQGGNTSRVEINGERYRKVTFYKAVYFPFNEEDITIGSQGVEMVKFKLSNQRDIFGRQYGQRGEKYFYSRPVNVKVKSLPPHPLREQVAVGKFRLQESADRFDGKTGESIQYQFKVQGTGNANAIAAPEIADTYIFDVYPPNSSATVRRNGSQLLSEKSFDYQLVLNEPGWHKLGDYFQWVYFDPDKESYDTLRSDLKIRVSGESLRNAAIASNILGGFYDEIGQTENELYARDGSGLRWILNISLLLFAALTGYLIWKR
ncbi:MAG: BatD family protein [Bacteroidota bacterium]